METTKQTITSKESFELLREVQEKIKNEHDYHKKQALRENELPQVIRNLVPETGTPCTVVYFSDYRAATIVGVLSDKAVLVQDNKTICKDYYSGDYEICSELEGLAKKFTKRKNGKWILEGHPTSDGVQLALHYQRHYIDPHF